MSSNQEILLWKVEPLSPSETPPLDTDDEWLYFDEKPAIFESDGEEPNLYEEQSLTRAQVASKLLEELELKAWVKEEPTLSDWILESKIDIPLFEEIPAPECGQNRASIIFPSSIKSQVPAQQQQQQLISIQQIGYHQHQQQHQPIDATQSLLREFETVLGDVEACHQISSVVSTLTPPQSPPPTIKQQQQQQQQHLTVVPNTHLLVSLQPLHHQTQTAFLYEQQHQQNHQQSVAIVPSNVGQQEQVETYTVSTLPLVQSIDQQIAEHWSAENLSLVPLVHANDVAHELAQVDEYVDVLAANVSPVLDSSSVGFASTSGSISSSSSAPPSPCMSSNASCISSEDSIDDVPVDDPDWSYEQSSSSSGSGRRTSQAGASTGRAGRRAKPYSRPTVEDKRVRKKEQNKNAATRYRQKKKLEVREILGEEQGLIDKNEKLQTEFKDLQREIGYLKNLMRDLFRAKGLIK